MLTSGFFGRFNRCVLSYLYWGRRSLIHVSNEFEYGWRSTVIVWKKEICKGLLYRLCWAAENNSNEELFGRETAIELSTTTATLAGREKFVFSRTSQRVHTHDICREQHQLNNHNTVITSLTSLVSLAMNGFTLFLARLLKHKKRRENLKSRNSHVCYSIIQSEDSGAYFLLWTTLIELKIDVRN